MLRHYFHSEVCEFNSHSALCADFCWQIEIFGGVKNTTPIPLWFITDCKLNAPLANRWPKYWLKLGNNDRHYTWRPMCISAKYVLEWNMSWRIVVVINKMHIFVAWTFSRSHGFQDSWRKWCEYARIVSTFLNIFSILLSCGTLLDVDHWSLVCDRSHNMPGQ